MTEQLTDRLADNRWQSATVIAISHPTPRIKTFSLVTKQPFVFRSGQHVDLRLTAEDGYRAMRSYSIGSSPSDSQKIEVSIERLDDGEVSSFFHDVVAVGDEIELRGPLGGHFIWRPADGGPLLLVGGGSGVVPLMSMVRQQQVEAITVPIVLLLSSRSWDDTLYRDELLDYHRAQSGFSLVLALTRESPRRTGDYGRRVDSEMIAEVLKRVPTMPKYIFVCGNNSFVNAAADGAVASKFPAGRIRTERYGE
jgi:ferredoxin-NADP reductase